MTIFNPLASSAFTGTDENPLSEGGVWTTATAESAFQRVSNAVTPSAVGVDCGAFYNAITWPANQYSRANITVNGTAGGGAGMGLKVRQASGAQTFYRFVIDHAATNNAAIERAIAGTFTTVDQWTQTFADGDQFTFGIEGEKLYVYDKNLTLVRSVSNSGISTGSAGLAYSSAETSASLDNWEAGWFSFAAMGVDLGNYWHPGASPGDAGAGGSGRFLLNWWPYSTATATSDVTVAISGVSSTTGQGTVGVTHTNAVSGVLSTAAVGTVKATLSKALSGVATTTGRGSVTVSHANPLAGVVSATAVGALKSSRTVALTGVQTVGAVGTVTVASADVNLAITGVRAVGGVGSVSPIGGDTSAGVVSKFRYIIYSKGKRHKSSFREMEELLDQIFSPTPAEPVAAPVVAEAENIVKPFVYKNELNLGKLEKDMRATRRLLDLWTAETARRADEAEDDDESILLMD